MWNVSRPNNMNSNCKSMILNPMIHKLQNHCKSHNLNQLNRPQVRPNETWLLKNFKLIGNKSNEVDLIVKSF